MSRNHLNFKTGLHYLLLISGSVIFIMPLIWMVRSALMDASEIFIVPPIWIPETFQFSNFQKALETVPFDRYFINTLFIAVCNVSGAVLTSAICAYSFSRLRWPGRDLIFGVLMTGLMLPFAVTLIPTFLG